MRRLLLASLVAIAPSAGQAQIIPSIPALRFITATADPTGASDAQPSIQASITTACAASPVAGVFIPPGTYDLKSPLLASCNGLTLFGVRGATTLIADAANSSATGILLTVSGRSHVTVQGITLDGNVANICATNKTLVLSVFNSSYVTFDQDTIQNTCGLALQFSTSITHSGVRNSQFINAGMYWHTSSAPTDAKQALVFLDTGTSYNSAGASSGNFATGNSFDTLGQDGIEFYYQKSIDLSHNTFLVGAGNQYYAAGVGDACIFGYGNFGATITNNRCDNASGNGIDLAGNAFTTISGNTVYQSGVHGILIATGRSYSLTFGDLSSTLIGNHEIDSGQNLSAGSAGVMLGQSSSGSGAQTITGTVVSANSAYDDQGTPTQAYGIGTQNAPTLANIWLDPSNYAFGNITAAVGSGLSVSGSPLSLGVYAAGRFFAPYAGATNVAVPAISTLWATPWRAQASGTLKSLAIDVGTARGTAWHVEMCIYSDSGSGVATGATLVGDTGSIAVSSSGTGGQSGTLNGSTGVQISPGLYWLVEEHDATGASVYQNGASNTTPGPQTMIGGVNIVTAVQPGSYQTGMNAAQAFGACPATFPTASYTTGVTPMVVLGF